MKRTLFLSLLLCVALGGAARAETWDGGAGTENLNWSTIENWLNDLAPDNPTTERVLFVDPLAPNSLLDASWSVGRLEFRSPEDTATAACSYNVNLGTNTQSVANLWVSQYGGGGNLGNNKPVNVLFSNGTLQVGTPDTPGDLLVSSAVWLSGEAELKFGAGTTLRGYLRNLYVGENADQNSTGQAILDLGGCTVEGGELNAANVRISTGKRAASIKLSSANGLASIGVAGNFEIGNGAEAHARIGDPSLVDAAGNWQLPANVNVQIGSEGSWGNLYVGRSTLAGAYGALVASSGGTFVAYLNDLEVGTKNETSGYSQDRSAYLDLSAMSTVTLDATRIKIGTATPPKASESEAQVRLPAGTAAAGTLEVGHPSTSGTCSALMELNGTTLSVATSATVYDKGTIRTKVRGTSCGLDLVTGATLTIDEGGTIDIVFDGTAPPPGIYWGLRAEGDRLAELEALNVDGKLIWDDTLLTVATGKTISVFKDDTHTYVGVSNLCDGDVNSDSRVNILDMIGIRNHLNQDPTTPAENQAYNVNGDDAINILDMIYVRNRLNNTCP